MRRVIDHGLTGVFVLLDTAPMWILAGVCWWVMRRTGETAVPLLLFAAALALPALTFPIERIQARLAVGRERHGSSRARLEEVSRRELE